MSTPSSHEIEAKFALTDARHAAALRATPALGKGFHLAAASIVTHTDLYLDTTDYTLIRSGHALRLRKTDKGVQAGLKSITLAGKTHWHKRLELEAFLAHQGDPLDWKAWPEEVCDYLAELLPEDKALQPVCVLRQNRHKRMIRLVADAHSDPVVELSVDEVQVYGVDTLSPAQDWLFVAEAQAPLATFWEVEAELLPGQEEACLATIAARLEHKRGVQPAARSKFERALEITHSHLIVDGEVVGQWLPTLTVADACRLVWRQQLAQLLLNEAGVRYSTEIEYVHDLRVAVRRMRTALQLFAPYFRRKSIHRFDRALRKMGHCLGAVRDRDVALERLEENSEEAERGSGQPGDFAGIETDWRSARNELYADLLAWLDSDRYRQFLEDLAGFCAKAGKGARKFTPEEGEPPQPHQVRHVLTVMLVQRFAQIRTFELLFAASAPMPAATLHQLRLQCKLFRYILEFAQPLLGANGAHLIESLKQLQDHLGVLNDAVVSQSLLADVAGDDQTAAQDYYAGQQAVIDKRRVEVEAAFTQFTGAQTRRLLARTIARL